VTPTGGRPLARFSVLDLTAVTAADLHRNKRSVAVNLQDPRGALVAGSVIEQHKGVTK
jgi:hypothetical protein